MKKIGRIDARAVLVRLGRGLFSRWAIFGLGAVLLYSLLGFLLIPYLARHYLPQIVADQLKRQATVGAIHLNPWLFTLEVRDFALTETDHRPIASFGRLFVDFDPIRAVTGPWSVADASLEAARLHLIVEPDGTLNLKRVADDMPKSQEPPEPPGETLHFRLGRLALRDLTLQYQDSQAGIDESLRFADLALDSLSTEVDEPGNYRLSAKLASGGDLTVHGSITMTPPATEGDLKLQGVTVAAPWRFLKDQLAIAEPGGVIDLSGHYRFEGGRLQVSDADLALSKLRLALADEPMLELGRIGCSKAQLDLADHSVKVANFSIEQGRVEVAKDASGTLNWQRLLKPAPPQTQAGQPPAEVQTQAPAPAESTQPPVWHLGLDELKVADLAIGYHDETRRVPLHAGVGSFALSLKAMGEFGGAAPKLQVSDLKAILSGLAVSDPGKAKPDIGLEVLELDGGSLDLEQQRVMLQKVALRGGGAAVEVAEDGRIPLSDRFIAKSSNPARAAKVQDGEGGAKASWGFELASVSLENYRLSYLNRSLRPPLAYDADDIDIVLKDIRSDDQTPASFDIGIALRQGGTVKVSGTAALTGAQVQAKVAADRLDLKPLQSALGRYAALHLDDGALSTALDVQYRPQPSGPELRASGTVAVDKLRTIESATKDRFLSWGRMEVEALDFSLNPDHLFAKEVHFIEPGSKIAIKEDRSINVVTVFREKIEKLPPSKPPEEPVPPARKAAGGGAFPVKIERVKFDKGVMDFSDHSLVIPFSTTIKDFGGTVTDVATTAEGHSRIDFSGRVEEFGSAKVDGILIPQKIAEDSSIKVVFRNVSMDSLSPYSATFAGRKIKSGKLNLDLDYRIQNGMLKSENKILLEEFTLGERVESPKAMSLPLDLAVALLTDSEGKIQASVPVEGDIRKPDFRYGKVIWDALVSLITRAATSPFRALGSLIGGGEGEDVGSLVFEPGSDILPPPEREKARKIVDALAKRPMIRLTVHGGYDAAADGEALRALRVRREVATAMKLELKPEEDPGPLSFSNADTQKALEEVAEKRGGAALVDSLVRDFESKAGRKPKRIGALGSLFGRAGEDQLFYESLYAQLVKTEPLPADALRQLADRRAAAVLKELSGQSGYDAARISKGAAETVSADNDKRVPVKLELGT